MATEVVKKEVKDTQILDAAAEELLNKGVDAASMHNIAAAAEVSKRTLYKYYPSKEALYNALVETILDRIEGLYSFDFVTTEDNGENIETHIGKVLDAKIELTLSDSFLKISKIVLGEMMKGRHPTPTQLERLNNSESEFIQWIQNLQSASRIRSDLNAEIVAEQFHSILKGQIYWPVILGLKSKDDIDISKVRQNTADFFLRSFSVR